MNNIVLNLASPPDRERVVVHIMIDNELFAEVNDENESIQIEFYSKQDAKPWVLNYDQLMIELTNAKNKIESTAT